MVRRYVLPCFLILVVAGAAGTLAFARESGVVYSSSCVFQAVIRLSREAPTTPEHEKFIRGLSLQYASTAVASGLYTRIGKAQSAPPAFVASHTYTAPSPGLGAFLVTFTHIDPKSAVRYANAVCDEYVSTIKKLRADAIADQVKGVENRITSLSSDLKKLEAVPAAKRTAVQNASIGGLRGALLINSQLISSIVSFPPDDISVLSRAAVVERKEPGDLSKNLIIAGVGGLLACFLYILVGEVLAERKRSAGETFAPDEPPVLSGRR